MKKISTIIALLTILSLTGCVPEAEDLQTSVLNSQLYEVVRVVDGDTVVVDINGKDESLRLIGIDTPETVHPSKPVECFGIEASDKAKQTLNGQKVYLETDSTQAERDKYNRLLMYIILQDGTNFNKMMIREGYAFEYTYGSNPYKYQTEFQYAQKQAEHDEIGLWSGDACE